MQENYIQGLHTLGQHLELEPAAVDGLATVLSDFFDLGTDAQVKVALSAKPLVETRLRFNSLEEVRLIELSVSDLSHAKKSHLVTLVYWVRDGFWEVEEVAALGRS